jgi:hypothetical protein
MDDCLCLCGTVAAVLSCSSRNRLWWFFIWVVWNSASLIHPLKPVLTANVASDLFYVVATALNVCSTIFG